jgi:hypothetical protein
MALYPKGAQPYMFGLSQCPYARLDGARSAPVPGDHHVQLHDRAVTCSAMPTMLARTRHPMIRRKTLTVLVYTPSRRWR